MLLSLQSKRNNFIRFTIILLEDLGMLFPTPSSKTKRHFGLYECPLCAKKFKCVIYDVKGCKTTKCLECSKRLKAKAMTQTKINMAASTFIESAIKIHGNIYDYSFVNYINARTTVSILCPIHGIFLQRPRDHKNGNGCPLCASYGFNKSKPAIMYYLRITYATTIVYKIGITNRTVDERFNKEDLQKIQVIKVWEYPSGLDAYNDEQRIISENTEYRYKGKEILQNGNTELFHKDILNLYKETYD